MSSEPTKVGWGIPIIVVVFGLWWLNSGQGPSANATGNGSIAQKNIEWSRVAQSAVRLRLKDGASAKFSGERVSHTSGVPVACGYVNARNGFGGYAGHVRYIYGGARIGAILESDMASGEMDSAWSKLCK